MKVIDRLRKMSPEQLATFLHYDLSSSDYSDCILNNLDKTEFCNTSDNCIERIKNYFNSEDDRFRKNGEFVTVMPEVERL